MRTIWTGSVQRLLLIGAFLLFAAASAYCGPVSTGSATVPPLPPDRARIWIYRDYLPSESLNMTAVAINGAVAGYAQATGGAFFRDVPPGKYLVTVESYGRDTDQSARLALGAGQEAFIKIESLRSWSSDGEHTSIGRDTFYARQIPPRLARDEMVNLPFYGGG